MFVVLAKRYQSVEKHSAFGVIGFIGFWLRTSRWHRLAQHTPSGYLLCPVFHSLGESAGELGRNDALPGPRVDGTASTKCNHGGVGISERLPIPVA